LFSVPENHYKSGGFLQGGADTVEEVFETTFFFMLHDSRDIQVPI
jgi:hypothetical protein